jgi:hypothetical protein
MVMANVSFEQKTQLVSNITDQLATAMLKMDKPAYLSSLSKEPGYFMPMHSRKQIEIDVLNILLYSKAYGLNKAKAIIRPWVSTFVHDLKVDAFGLFQNSYGNAVLLTFNRVEVESISPKQMVVYSENDENIILYRTVS